MNPFVSRIPVLLSSFHLLILLLWRERVWQQVIKHGRTANSIQLNLGGEKQQKKTSKWKTLKPTRSRSAIRFAPAIKYTLVFVQPNRSSLHQWSGGERERDKIPICSDNLRYGVKASGWYGQPTDRTKKKLSPNTHTHTREFGHRVFQKCLHHNQQLGRNNPWRTIEREVGAKSSRTLASQLRSTNQKLKYNVRCLTVTTEAEHPNNHFFAQSLVPHELWATVWIGSLIEFIELIENIAEKL